MKKNKTASFASPKNTGDKAVSPNEMEDSAINDIKEVLDKLVVSPIMDNIPNSLNKTETAITDSIENKADDLSSEISNLSNTLWDIKDTLSSTDFSRRIARACGTEEIKMDIEDLKDDVGDIKNSLDNVISKVDKIFVSVPSEAEVNDNIPEFIKNLVEEVEAQREMILKQADTIEQLRSIIEKFVSEMTSAKNRFNGMNKQVRKTHK